MKNKIPDRWLEYTPMGAKVAGTRFIAFKAPLSREICSKIKPAERFTPEILMERCPNMRLIIDLTNTDRYYNKQEFIDRGIQYEKIMCPGQVIPPQSLIFRFFEIIDDFYLKNGLKDVLIGIHCTHGVNRTGYFIGRYMVQRMGFHYDKAIPCIEEARGHKIERPNYIKDLMVQVPIPSSLSSSSGKKVIESKPQQKKVTSNSGSKASGKINKEKTPEKPYSRKPGPEIREPPGGGRMRKSPDQGFRSREPTRQDNYGPGGGRSGSPPRRGGVSPPRRGPSPGRRGFSPGRRAASPSRRGGRGPSPKRQRTPPRTFSPRRRSPPRRSPPRRLSPPRREGDFSAPPYRGGEERDFPRGSGFSSSRGYSPARRNEPPAGGFPPRGPPENQNFGPPPGGDAWKYNNDDRGFHLSGGPSTNFGPPPNQFPDSRPPTERHHPWENRPVNQPPFKDSRPPYGGGPGAQQWTPPNNFSAPPPPLNVPPNFDSRPGNFNNPPPGRYNDRRFEDPKFPPREEPRRPWDRNEDRPTSSGPPFNNSNRFEENRGFSDRGPDYRPKPDDKFEKPYRSTPPRGDFLREKRPPSPFRDSRREFDDNFVKHSTRTEASGSWDNRRRSPVPPFGDKADPSYVKSGGRRRSRSPGRRSPPTRRPYRSRTRSPPRRRSPPRSSGFEQRRTPPRGRPVDQPPQFSAPPPQQHGPSRSGPEPPYQDKRFYESRDDCRDLLNQKRNYDGVERGGFFNDGKPAKLGVRDIPKEVDLRNVISSVPPNDPSVKNRLGPPARDDAMDGGRKFGRARSRSPRGRSPSRYGGPPRRYHQIIN